MLHGRRAFITGMTASGLAVAGVLPACSSGNGPPEGVVGDLSVARFYGPYFPAGSPARVPFGLADDEGLLSGALSPAEITVTVTDAGGETVVDGVASPVRVEGLPRPYYTVEFTPEEAGFFDLDVDPGYGDPVRTQVQIVDADDPATARIIGPGDRMPDLVTPTVADPAGVTPICTREPACDLHARTVADVLAAGEPLALLVATPAFCQTVVCGPVLDVFLDVLGEVPGVTAVHAEVYRDPEDNESPPVPADFAPVVADLGLAFEPVLYTVGADGRVRERLDYIFGTDEVRAALERLVA